MKLFQSRMVNIVIIIWILIYNLYPPVLDIQAQGENDTQLIQEDLDADQSPELTIIRLKIITPKDEISVYDGADDMKLALTWQQATDFKNDTWIFDIGGDKTAQLIIKYYQSDKYTYAAIYDDQNNDGKVAYLVNNHEVVVQESSYPPLTVQAEGDWFLSDNKLNWNIKFITDGPSIKNFVQYDPTSPVFRLLKLDGNSDMVLEFFDDNLDGTPEWGIWRLLGINRDDWGLIRTVMRVNKNLHTPTQPTGHIFWPYLNPSTRAMNYFDIPPAISIDWATSRITAVDFAGYPIENGYHVFSQYQTTLDPKVVNYVDFENIQAYYDLAQDNDSYPELHIRHRYHAANDPYGLNLPSPINEIRWSWNQSNSSGNNFDYFVGLAGRHTITDTVTLSDFTYLTIPYENLPQWVLTNTWDIATFVAWEGATPYTSSEGIYGWGAVETAINKDGFAISRYLAGVSKIDIRQAFTPLPAGNRSEVVPYLNGQVGLYISKLDGKLHLKNAEYGYWTLPDERILRYEDLNSDGYFDHVTFTENNVVTQEFGAIDNLLLFGDNHQIMGKITTYTQDELDVLPPTTTDEYLELGKLLQQQKHNLQPGDISTLLTQFGAPDWSITGASLKNFRMNEPTAHRGLRFEMTVSPGYQVSGNPPTPLMNLSPGNYLVVYDDFYSIQKLPQPSLNIKIQSSLDIHRIGEPNQLTLQIENKASQDLPDATLIIEQEFRGDKSEIERVDIQVLGNSDQFISTAWNPIYPGEWKITARVEDGNNKPISDTLVIFQVDDIPFHTDTYYLNLANTFPALIFLASVALLFTFVYRSSIRSQEGITIRLYRASNKQSLDENRTKKL